MKDNRALIGGLAFVGSLAVILPISYCAATWESADERAAREAREREQASSPQAAAPPATPATPEASPLAAAAPRCPDVSEVYAPTVDKPDDKARREAIERVSKWTPACRLEAMKHECQRSGCSGVHSDALIEGAPGEEGRSLRHDRMRWTKAALNRYLPLVARAEEIHAHAMRTRGTPRGDDACFDRMHKDFDRIGALRAELSAKKAELPYGWMVLDGWLIELKACLNCHPGDVGRCDDAADERTTNQVQVIDYWAKEIQGDEKALSRAAP